MNEFAKWFAAFDESLLCDSRQASLQPHNLTAGNIREYLISELLQRFLPTNVSVESGHVFDRKGKRSKQVDLILFDSRVPCLRPRLGPGLFPVEGVLAAIEIKTSITSAEKLIEALNNCFSVAECEITATGDFWTAFKQRHKELVTTERKTPLDAYIRLAYLLFPPTYIFAINDGLLLSTLRDGVDNWFHRAKNHSEMVPVVPRMILSGSCVGATHDGLNEIQLPTELKNSVMQEVGPNGRSLMAFWPDVKHRLSWFASRLLMSINMRTGIMHDYLKVRYDIERYMPLRECFALENMVDREAEHVIWNGEFPGYKKVD